MAGLLDVFRSSFEVTPQPVDIQRIALIAAVAGKLAGKATIPSFADVEASEVFRRAGDVLHRRYAARSRLASSKAAVAATNAVLERDRAHLSDLRVQYTKAVLEGSVNAPALKAAIIDVQREIAEREGKTAYQRMSGLIETIESVVTAIDAGLDALTKPSSDAPPPIVLAALREHVRRAGGNRPLVLWVDITASGADRVRRQTPLGWNSEIAFLGAVQATFILADADGTVRAGGAKDKFGSQTFDFANFFGESTTETRTAKSRAMVLEYGIMLLIAAVIVLLLVAVVIGVVF